MGSRAVAPVVALFLKSVLITWKKQSRNRSTDTYLLSLWPIPVQFFQKWEEINQTKPDLCLYHLNYTCLVMNVGWVILFKSISVWKSQFLLANYNMVKYQVIIKWFLFIMVNNYTQKENWNIDILDILLLIWSLVYVSTPPQYSVWKVVPQPDLEDGWGLSRPWRH